MRCLKTEYEKLEDIGKGRFGTVSKIYSKKYNLFFAIKTSAKILPSHISDRNLSAIMYKTETSILPRISQKNIVHIYDFFETEDQYNIILEYCSNGTLEKLIETSKAQKSAVQKVPVSQATAAQTKSLLNFQTSKIINTNPNLVISIQSLRFFSKQILEALEYCHARNVCHRDLKPSNICFDSTFQIKVVDWGFALKYPQGTTNFLTNSFCGTFPYAAPECIKRIPYDARKSDMWSFGVTLYEAAFGHSPFEEPSPSLALEKALRCEYIIPENSDLYLTDLIQKLLQPNPDLRLDAKLALSHPFYSEYQPAHEHSLSSLNLYQMSKSNSEIHAKDKMPPKPAVIRPKYMPIRPAVSLIHKKRFSDPSIPKQEF